MTIVTTRRAGAHPATWAGAKAGRGGSRRALAGRALPMAVVGVAGALLWELGVRAFDVPPYILPAPSAIFAALGANLGEIIDASARTFQSILLGMALGAVSGMVIALLVSLAPRLAAPLVSTSVVASCAPIVALAPIFNAWFGVTTVLSKAAVAAVMVFFPVFVSTAQGMLRVDPLHRELMESLSASRSQTLFLVRVPAALPSTFDGLRVSSTLSVIGIIVAEYFGGPSNALGVYIANQAALSRFPATWSGVLVASILGLVVFGAVVLIERLCLPWRDHASASSDSGSR